MHSGIKYVLFFITCIIIINLLVKNPYFLFSNLPNIFIFGIIFLFVGIAWVSVPSKKQETEFEEYLNKN